ncbi:glycosyltransferase involved in cell wall biosynthesis [Deinococcus metalli]|uniref:Glycosyltransferase involved in cell wall biosynthesis n=1 Tax=Deinococcus metalli TaxID=1141878 RepID=A0A7W8KCZ2_9DEIO|nr:glycosyltransferase family 4 protein [Deinococcus metalli]MBB5375917.1 glycosyltransferase involved in cell wall biosynthesis [Deinococcus metalli]
MRHPLARHPHEDRPLRIGMLAPIAWRVPPRHYGPWERVVSLLTEGLVAAGADVTLYATQDALTSARLSAVVPAPYEETPGMDVKVWEGLHLAHAFGDAARVDVLHNHADFLPLMFASLVTTPTITTIHGFSGAAILPAYTAYADRLAFVSISDADRSPALPYVATVYHGIDLGEFTYRAAPDDPPYLAFLGRLHPDKGAADAIRVACAAGLPLKLAGIIHDRAYFDREIEPQLGGDITYLGSVGPPERDRLLGGAAALLHLIHFDEPFGLSVLEAMACGTPVIAYGRGSMRELIDDGVSGFVVPDEAAAVIAVHALDGLDRAAVRARAETFSVARMVDGYLRVYRQLILGRVSS